MIVSCFSPLVVEAYISCEVSPGGDWYNLVILAEGAEVEDFTQNNSVHCGAVKEVAPLYYSHVRIHRGILDINMEHGKKLDMIFTRTLALHYKNGAVISRNIRLWQSQKKSRQLIRNIYYHPKGSRLLR